MATNEFDPIHSHLQPGINLIEAAAGTGKTYAIVMLVLRFVVEHALDIKRLLVVTFTKAATEELKERIRSKLGEARQFIKTNNHSNLDPSLKIWLDNLPLDKLVISKRLELALLNIDQTAILTIHGFCQRVLLEQALESGQMFDSTVNTDITSISQNCADDFWRIQIDSRPLWQVGVLTACFPTPDALLSSLNRINPHQTVYPEYASLDSALEKIKSLQITAYEALPANTQKLECAFQSGHFKDSFIKNARESSADLATWLTGVNPQPVDFSWLTTAGLMAGLNGRKFLVSKNKPLPSEQQKQLYINGLGIDNDVFDHLQRALRQLQVIFRRALLQSLRKDLDKALQKNNTMSYDGLITRLYQALSAEHAQILKKQLQQNFQVALIDEFQDTDHQQWQIFLQIFATPDHFLYLIGDPKQAIYKFRGADIYSYFQAQKQANRQYTLLHNWRSHPDLVEGVNHLFKRNRPFFLDKLAFHPVKPARTVSDGKITDQAPLIVWQLDKNQGNLEHWTSTKAFAVILDAVIKEILHLLTCNTQIDSKIASRLLKPQDIAILVRNNAQAYDYQQALNKIGIPAVLNSKQSVFASSQALELQIVLQAIAQPDRVSSLKQALTVSWFNLDGQTLYAMSNDETSLDNWISRFQDYHLLWQKHGLLAMMLRLLEQEQVEVNLCTYPQAERTLTNLHHIIERLQQASIEENLAINKTLDWLRNAIQQSGQNGNEEQLLRLDSDEDTVKIVTLHSAKGLEFPIVFCPNLWQRSGRLKSEQHLVQCHENDEMIADLGSDDFEYRREIAIHEELAEDLRLFYVAVTRAKYRCYLAWADVRSKDIANQSGMAYLLEFENADFAVQQRKLVDLTTKLPEAFQYALLTANLGEIETYQHHNNTRQLACWIRQRALQSHWQMSSYTALSALSIFDAPELPQEKALEPADVNSADQYLYNDLSFDYSTANHSHNTELPTRSYKPVYDDLPAGAQTGNLVHSLLETLSFKSLATGDHILQARDLGIRRYGLSIENPTLIDRLLETIVTTPLSEEDCNFCLKNIEDRRCLKEMPFYLSMQMINIAEINRILAKSISYQPLSSKTMSGYLTGFIDLVCEYQGKYYVMDYKTNKLPDYRYDTLLQAMRNHNYGLQYWLYCLVLDQYLQQRLPDYRYSEHFGGVKYLFVRGLDVNTPGVGVFTDLPDENTLKQLCQLFFGKING